MSDVCTGHAWEVGSKTAYNENDSDFVYTIVVTRSYDAKEAMDICNKFIKRSGDQYSAQICGVKYLGRVDMHFKDYEDE